MNMKTFNAATIIFAIEDTLYEGLNVLSITNKPCFSHRTKEWRETAAYSQAWNFIADRIIEEIKPELECAIDDNYMRVFVHSDSERDNVYELIEKYAAKIDDYFG